ncbi:class II fructose-bisphosphatase [Paenibacillus cisolokensis]|uniref:class II fructose-bisphosphatase n=1 Tax=Paenibacillus cisolokensis TaxID=1658519 RepID=UPI003D2AD82B
MKRLLFDFLQVAEAAALVSYPWVGRGNKHEADQAATSAMRLMLNKMEMDATVVIGEGEMDEAPMLHIGERLGTGRGPELDIAVDPLEGTNLVAYGQENSTTVIAAAPRGTLLHAPDMYMYKMAVGPKAKGSIDLERSIVDNVRNVADALGKDVSELTVMVQQRERHADILQEIKSTGARAKLFTDGDVTCAIATAVESTGVDLFVGIGGAPEGVLSAVALKCLGGEMQAKLLPANDEERERCKTMGIHTPDIPLEMDRLVSSDDCIFVATGITTGVMLNGIQRNRDGTQTTHSLVTYGGGQGIHFVTSHHKRLIAV